MLDRHLEVIKQPNETHCMLSKRNYVILSCRMLLTIISPCLTRGGGVYPLPLSSRIFTMAKKQTVVLAWNFANIFLPQVDIVSDFCLLKSDGFLLRYSLFCNVTTREFCRKVDKRRGSVKDAFLWKILNANERPKYVHWHALKDGHLWLFEMLGVSLLKFQPILSKATCENCLHVVAGNNTYYYLSYASGQA